MLFIESENQQMQALEGFVEIAGRDGKDDIDGSDLGLKRIVAPVFRVYQ